MPSNLSLNYFSNHPSQKSICMDNTQIERPKSLVIGSITNSDEEEKSRSALYYQPKDSYQLSPLRKLSTFSRRKLFSRRRSHTIATKFEPTIDSPNEPIKPQNPYFLAVTPSETNQRHHSFKENFRNFFESTLQRSNSFNNFSLKKKVTRSQTQPGSPLTFCKPPMGRRMMSCTIPGLRDEESNPASVEDFVRKCANCFDAAGKCIKEHFLRILFLTHSWFMTSEQLMVLFSKLYEEEKEKTDYKMKVLFAIRFWMNEFPHIFDLDQDLVDALNELQELIAKDPDVDSSLIDLNNKNSYKWMSAAQMSVRTSYVDRKQRKVSLVFNHLEPEDIAIHMSYLEYNSFRRLTLSDFHNYAVRGMKRENEKLERAVFLFNNITHWVQCMVLDHHNINDRAMAIVKFVEVAKKLHTMRNFNTLMAIVGALTHTAIARLKKTMAEVPKATQKTLDEFVELLDSKANYSSYRRTYNSITDEFKIPVIGILMKDITALHAADPDRVGDELINLRKMLKIGSKFEEIFRLQRIGFPYPVNKHLVNTLRVSLYLYYNEEEIYQLSVQREPRDNKHSTSGSNTSSPTKSVTVGFSEFSCCSCQVDDDTIKQHVNAMVKSVFKSYDLNSDEYISEAEFGSFIQNFPGLDSFAIMDKDNDGKISKDEMIEYFLKISSARRNQVCQSFKHDFVEVTYYSPAFCEECDKLLWGLVKQGWKCRVCGINCHKHCKDRIVLECRPKLDPKHSNSGLHSQKKQTKRKDKASISSESDFSVNGDHSRPSAPHDDDAFDNGDRKSPDKTSSNAKSASNHILRNSKQLNGKKTTKTSGGKGFARKTSSPSLTYETKKKYGPFTLLLKKNSPRLKNRDLLSPLIDDQKDKSPKKLYKKAHSFEDVNDLKNKNVKIVKDKKEKERLPSDSTVQDPEHKIDYNRNETIVAVVTNSKSRYDSLVNSNCSGAVTPSTSSSPHTPLSSEPATTEIRFQYPPPSNLPTILAPANDEDFQISNPCSISNGNKSVESLVRENVELRLQLHRARDVISDLESKLANLSPTS